MFLTVLTWWALYTPLRRTTFNRIKCLLAVYAAVHFSVMFTYQIPFFQDLLPSDNFAARYRYWNTVHPHKFRLLGLSSLMQTNCDIYWRFELPVNPSWTAYVNYALTLLLYFTIIVQYRWTRDGIDRYSEQDGDDDSTVHEEVSCRRLKCVELPTSPILLPINVAFVMFRREGRNAFLTKIGAGELNLSMLFRRKLHLTPFSSAVCDVRIIRREWSDGRKDR